jgi:hypothetical protein
LRAKGLKASPRTLWNWRRRYLIYGFAGLVRQRRCDSGRPRTHGLLVRIAEAALRVRRYGDVRREYLAGFRNEISYEQLRAWLRWVQARVVVMPRRSEG